MVLDSCDSFNNLKKIIFYLLYFIFWFVYLLFFIFMLINNIFLVLIVYIF